LVKLR